MDAVVLALGIVALLIASHTASSAGYLTLPLFAALVRHRGIDRPTYSLGYDLLFAVPGMNRMLRRCGVLPCMRHSEL